MNLVKWAIALYIISLLAVGIAVYQFAGHRPNDAFLSLVYAFYFFLGGVFTRRRVNRK